MKRSRRQKVGIVFLAIVILGVAIFAIAVIQNEPVPDHPFFAGGDFMVIAHRGGRGLWPESTLYAYEQAAALGVDVLEMDVHRSADGILVVMHDDDVDRTTNGKGPIKSLTLAELKSLDAGYNFTTDDGATFPFRGQGITVPTLAEIFDAFPDMLMNIEIKQAEPSIVDQFCQVIKDYGREGRTLVGSFHVEAMKDFRKECPAVASSATESELRFFFVLNTIFLGAAYHSPAEAFQVPEYQGSLHVTTGRFVSGAQSHNVAVHVWTVNEPEDMQRMLDLGADGIITDYPDRLLDLLSR